MPITFVIGLIPKDITKKSQKIKHLRRKTKRKFDSSLSEVEQIKYKGKSENSKNKNRSIQHIDDEVPTKSTSTNISGERSLTTSDVQKMMLNIEPKNDGKK